MMLQPGPAVRACTLRLLTTGCVTSQGSSLTCAAQRKSAGIEGWGFTTGDELVITRHAIGLCALVHAPILTLSLRGAGF